MSDDQRTQLRDTKPPRIATVAEAKAEMTRYVASNGLGDHQEVQRLQQNIRLAERGQPGVPQPNPTQELRDDDI